VSEVAIKKRELDFAQPFVRHCNKLGTH